MTSEAPSEDSPPKQRASEENLMLRRTLHKQEEKVRLLATKLVRVLSERKSRERREGQVVDGLKARITVLEAHNESLQGKVAVLREQLASYTKLIPSSGRVPPKGSKSKKSVVPSRSVLGDVEFTSRVEQLLLEAKAENQALEDQLRVTRDRLASTENEMERCAKTMRELESSHTEELLALRAQLDTNHERHHKRKQVSDNIQLIKLQRESRRTSSWLATLETQRASLQASLNTANETIEGLETEVSNLREEVQAGQEKVLSLQRDLESAEGSVSRIKELEATLQSVSEENRILKEANESLLKKTLKSPKKAASPRSKDDSDTVVRELRGHLTQLEVALKVEKRGKGEALEALEKEKLARGECEASLNDFKSQLYSLQEQYKSVQNLNKNYLPPQPLPIPRHAGEEEALRNRIVSLESELGETQWQLVEVRDELSKTRSLLKTQVTIAGEGQREVEALTAKLDRAEESHGVRLAEFMRLLEERSHQMTSLERSLAAILQKKEGEAAPHEPQSAAE